MHSTRPANMTYNSYVIPKDTSLEPYYESIPDNPYKTTGKKPKDKYITFIVFSSSEIILSGRYFETMMAMYNFFIDTVFRHRHLIEEKVVKPDEQEIADIRRHAGRKKITI